MAEDDPHGSEPGGQDTPWWARGREPDYRATMANERTFLAWTRTSLALLASSLAVARLFGGVPQPLSLALAGLLILLSLAATAVGYAQWRTRQARMRLGLPLGHYPVQVFMAAAFVVLAGMVAAMVALTPTNR